MINFSFPVIELPETDSTSNYLTALSNSEALKEFTVVRTNYQSAGKGQRGNGWESETGKNLLFSFILYPTFLDVQHQFMLSKAIALAIKEELDGYAEHFSIKWPNDIYWQERKICGTLIENDLMGSVIKKSIVGIGININQEAFLGTAPNPVSLMQITGMRHDINAILEGVMSRIITNYNLLKDGEPSTISNRYHHCLFRKKGFHAFRDSSGEFRAKIVEVKPVGTLILMDEEEKVRSYAFKEVQYIV